MSDKQKLNLKRKYRFMQWLASFRIYSYIHGRGFWYPVVPITLSIALLIKSLAFDNAIGDYLLWFSIVLYFGEIPLLIALTRRAQRQSIYDVGISDRDILMVKDGLTKMGSSIHITQDMTYRNFIACRLLGELYNSNKGELK